MLPPMAAAGLFLFVAVCCYVVVGLSVHANDLLFQAATQYGGQADATQYANGYATCRPAGNATTRATEIGKAVHRGTPQVCDVVIRVPSKYLGEPASSSSTAAASSAVEVQLFYQLTDFNQNHRLCVRECVRAWF